MNNLEIIDFEKKGNVVRFYLGSNVPNWGYTRADYKDYRGQTPDWLKPSDKYYGDDWNDRPYEHNAGKVYDEFVKAYIDVSFDFNSKVLEPRDGEFNSPYCKDDFVARKVPCLAVYENPSGDDYDNDFRTIVARKDTKKIYFGDSLSVFDDFEDVIKGEVIYVK